MDSRTKLLLEKYWRAETSTAEERLLKEQLGTVQEASAEANYFKAIDRRKQQVSEISFQHPGKRIYYWYVTIAASLVIGLLVATGLWQRQQSSSEYTVHDPEMALELTRNALLMVSSGLNEGKDLSTYQLNQINKPKEIITNKNNSNIY
jgi:hypothetical protein